MSENSAMFKYDEYGNTREIYVYASGLGLHSDPFINRGTAFTIDERQRLGLVAMLPPAVRSLEEQVENSRVKVEAKELDIDRFKYLIKSFLTLCEFNSIL